MHTYIEIKLNLNIRTTVMRSIEQFRITNTHHYLLFTSPGTLSSSSFIIAVCCCQQKNVNCVAKYVQILVGIYQKPASPHLSLLLHSSDYSPQSPPESLHHHHHHLG